MIAIVLCKEGRDIFETMTSSASKEVTYSTYAIDERVHIFALFKLGGPFFILSAFFFPYWFFTYNLDPDFNPLDLPWSVIFIFVLIECYIIYEAIIFVLLLSVLKKTIKAITFFGDEDVSIELYSMIKNKKITLNEFSIKNGIFLRKTNFLIDLFFPKGVMFGKVFPKNKSNVTLFSGAKEYYLSGNSDDIDKIISNLKSKGSE